MSVNGLQHVVGRAAIDSEFLRLLAQSPTDALYGFDLAADETSMIMSLQPQSLMELARGVEAWRRGDLSVSRPAFAQPALAALAV